MRSLYVDESLCKGCTSCELACSFKKEGEFRPAVARLHVVKEDWEAIEIPMVCTQCGKCAEVCPKKAISYAPHGAYVVDETKCNDCGDCIEVCPDRVIFMHPETGKAVKCDLCGGEPECVLFCPFGALSFAGQATINRMRRKDTAEKVTAEIVKERKEKEEVKVG